MSIREQRLENLFKWESMLKEIFPISIPYSCVWEDKQEILSVLNIVGSIASANHMFCPEGGGIDMAGAIESVEKDCIEISSGENSIPYIIKPKNLKFNSFNSNHEWSYFRIETNYLEPSGIYKKDEYKHEEITEITPGVYRERSVWDYEYYNYDLDNNREKPLPETARLIVRYMEGSFVIFAKSSPYNFSELGFDPYDGRHNLMSNDEFKKIISEVAHLRIDRV